ncbi:MAG: hypothetical protein ACTSR8_09160 [Promethearchaeota archaeon]
MNEIFFEVKTFKTENDLTSEIGIEIILHFLAKVDEYLVLYGTQFKIAKPKNSNIDNEAITELKRVFSQVDPNISLVRGKIKEIFLSYST